MLFSSLGLSADLGPLLDAHGITVPTPIQEQAIPVVRQGRDLIGIAQTGTGKTLAFGLPLIEALRNSEGTALILAPTRELATQIATSLRHFTGPFKMRTAVLVGGMAMGPQLRDLHRKPQIVIATPGRLLDHASHGSIRLNQFTHVVLDEADRMLDMGFLPAIRRIFEMLRDDRQTLMFSATMPEAVDELAHRKLKDPVRIEVEPQGTPIEAIEQVAYVVDHEDKASLLNDLVTATDGPVLVFTRTRHGARKVAKSLRSYGHSAVEIHADRTQAQRDAAMSGFRSGHNRVLVATDIAARGIDVKDIELVVQYDLPDMDEDYVHRIGRTGRAGASGRAAILVTPEHCRKFDRLEDYVGYQIATADDSPLPRPVRTVKHRPPSRNASERPRFEQPRREDRPRFEQPRNEERPRYEQPRRDDRARPETSRGNSASSKPSDRREPQRKRFDNDNRQGQSPSRRFEGNPERSRSESKPYQSRSKSEPRTFKPRTSDEPWKRPDESKGNFKSREAKKPKPAESKPEASSPSEESAPKRNRPNTTPKAFRGKPPKKKKTGVPGGGFVPPKRKRR